ncbi:MAG TPA: lysophospholipid acyltransferase family protein [Nannocystis sp.]|jgi:lysophospholipid acyltransferase (LPLAT)-like uncharacterized protein
MRDGLRFRLAGSVGGWVLDALFRTATFDVIGEENYAPLRDRGTPCFMVIWHGRLLPAGYYHRGRGMVGLISRSQDGEYIARVLRRWGYDAVRGSSSRGGMPALREIVRLARSGRTIAITPDGPRGPRQKLKPGVLAAARATGLPMVPVAAGADRAWWFESWDRFLVPKPFARIRVAYGPPLEVPRDAGPEEIEAIGRRLEAELNRLVEVVDGTERR